jgi:hypothetical protein
VGGQLGTTKIRFYWPIDFTSGDSWRLIFFTASYKRDNEKENPSRRLPLCPCSSPIPSRPSSPVLILLFSSRDSAAPLHLPGRHHQRSSLAPSGRHPSCQRRADLLYGLQSFMGLCWPPSTSSSRAAAHVVLLVEQGSCSIILGSTDWLLSAWDLLLSARQQGYLC